RSGQTPLPNPRLSCVRNAIASSDRHTQPQIAFLHAGDFLKGLPGAHSHVVILRSQHANVEFPRGAEGEPGTKRVVTAPLCPVTTQRLDCDLCGFGCHHAFGAEARNISDPRTFNGEDTSFLSEHGRDLLSLNASDLFVIRYDRVNRNLSTLAQL